MFVGMNISHHHHHVLLSCPAMELVSHGAMLEKGAGAVVVVNQPDRGYEEREAGSGRGEIRHTHIT